MQKIFRSFQIYLNAKKINLSTIIKKRKININLKIDGQLQA